MTTIINTVNDQHLVNSGKLVDTDLTHESSVVSSGQAEWLVYTLLRSTQPRDEAGGAGQCRVDTRSQSVMC